MTILALDLATCTGWAYGRPGDTPTFGSVRLVPAKTAVHDRRPRAFRMLREWLIQFTFNHTVRVVIFEAPLPPTFKGGFTNMNSLMMLYGLAAHVEEVCYDCSHLQVLEASVSEVRRHFIGTAKLKRAQAKPEVIRRCQQLGLNPTDDNQADAIATWHYQASLMRPALAIETSPLFQGRTA